jgi:hypothetical protein
MFYFQQLLNQGLDGIDRTAMIPTMVGIGYTILLIGFLIGLYQAAMRGGDVQSLAATGIKYLVVAIILANWSTVFREVNGAFNQVAQFIDSSSGAGDMFLGWMDQLKQQFSTSGFSSLLPSISASLSSIVTALLILIAYLVFAVMVVVFAFFYTLYGCILYVLGPLVLALLPMGVVGQLAKSYATNVMIWNAWGILYATLGSLITAIQFGRVDQVLSQGFLKGFFQGASDSIILGLVSIIYALALGLIPFIAKRLIAGDVGATAISLVKAGAAAVGSVLAGASGFAAGTAAGSSSATTAGSSAGAGSAATANISSSAPPPQPSLAETIRSGVMSAAGASPPTAPSTVSDQSAGSSAGSGSSGSRSHGSRSQSGGSGAPPPLYRPVGVTQTIAFHAARLAASLASGGEANPEHSGGNGTRKS